MADRGDAPKPTLIDGLAPSHARVVSLRLQGKRWSEIANDLGITDGTLRQWRIDHPEIEETIGRESLEFLEATKHALLAGLPEAAATLLEVMRQGSYNEKHAAARTLLELFRKQDGRDMQPASVLSKVRSAAGLSDDELDARAARAAVVVSSRVKR